MCIYQYNKNNVAVCMKKSFIFFVHIVLDSVSQIFALLDFLSQILLPVPAIPTPSIDKFTNKSNGLSFLLPLCKKVTQFCFRFASFAFCFARLVQRPFENSQKNRETDFFTLKNEIELPCQILCLGFFTDLRAYLQTYPFQNL